MDWFQIGLAIAAGLGLGWIINRNRNVNYDNLHVINKDVFVKNMRRGQLVDIRKKDVYEQNHINGARQFDPGQITGKSTKLRRDLPVYIYCQNGRKSKRVAKKLIRDEFSTIYVLKDGFENYNN